MSAMDAYYKKVVLAEDLPGTIYRTMMDGRVKSVRGDSDSGANAVPSIGVYGPKETGDSVVEQMITAVQASYCYYVSPHMDALVTAAAESLPEDVTVEQYDPPTPQGFLWIPGGLTVIDIRGRVLKYNAALWTTFGGLVRVWWLTDKYDENDMTNLELRLGFSAQQYAKFPQLTPNGESMLRFGHEVPLMLGQSKVLPPEVKTALVFDPVTKNVMLSWPEGYGAEELADMVKSGFQPKPDNVSRWLLACWRLMQQSITTLDQEPIPRKAQKLGRRANLPDQHVTVVDLRHGSTKSTGEGAVEWSHRWLVRGHWRMQPFKDDGVWKRKPIFIHPHVKGPEGAPLVIRDHVYNLKR